MKKAQSMLPTWDQTKKGSKKGFDKVWAWADKLGAPINRFTNKIGSEAFWPTTLDKESDKAARILRSFCKDGFYVEEDDPTKEVAGPKNKQKVIKKIPPEVIQNAVGLAIFTVMRTGLWISGAGGSGVLVARKEDGSWSQPSGILLHTAGLGFLVGVDIYDCVVVINNRKALEAFTKVRATLGGEISVAAGPVGAGGVLEHDGKWKQVNKPVFTYLKSRGFYAGVQVDGTIVIERTDENERFYGQRIPVADILAGKVRHERYETRMLMETLKAAEGRSDVDQELMFELDDQPAPGDVEVEAPGSHNGQVFGIPQPDDPDPFGVLALEKQGLEIREAGSRSRPSSSQFEFKPSPTSPIYAHFHRRSVDTITTSNRGSYMSNKTGTSVDRATQTSESGTQTDPDDLNGSLRSPVFSNGHRNIISEEMVHEPEEVDYTKIDLGPYSRFNNDESENDRGTSTRDHDVRNGHRTDDSYTTDDEEEDEPVIYEAAAATTRAPQINLVKAKGSLVNIPRRVPPPLPPRHPMRSSGVIEQSDNASPSPSKDGFEEVELNGERDNVASVRRVDSPIVLVNGVEDETLNSDKLEEEKANDEKVEEFSTKDEAEKHTNGDTVDEFKADNSAIETTEPEADHDAAIHAHTETDTGKLESEKDLRDDAESAEEATVEGDNKLQETHAERISTDSKREGNDEHFHSLPETPLEEPNHWA